MESGKVQFLYDMHIYNICTTYMYVRTYVQVTLERKSQMLSTLALEGPIWLD